MKTPKVPKVIYTQPSVFEGQTELWTNEGYAGHVEPSLIDGCYNVFDKDNTLIGTADKSLIGDYSFNAEDVSGFVDNEFVGFDSGEFATIWE